MLIKQKSPSLSRSFALRTFGELPSAIPPLFNVPEVLSSASDKAKVFAENFTKDSSLDDSGIFLLVFSSKTNMKLHKNFCNTQDG